MLSKAQETRAPSRNCPADGTPPEPQVGTEGVRPKTAPEATRHPQPSALADRDEVKGRSFFTTDGYGFVVPDSPMPQLDGDVFIPRDAIQDAMHGDHVLAKIQRLGGVTGAQRAEGASIQNPGPRASDRGRFVSLRNPTQCVLPYDVRIQHEVEIPRATN